MVYFEPMDHDKKIGIILIAIGFCIPLIALPFITGYDKNRGFYDNFYKVGIRIKNNKQSDKVTQHPQGVGNKKLKTSDIMQKIIPETIQFRFFLVFTVIFIYIGIVRIDRSKRRARNELDTHG
jgi:hypothetical protein